MNFKRINNYPSIQLFQVTLLIKQGNGTKSKQQHQNLLTPIINKTRRVKLHYNVRSKQHAKKHARSLKKSKRDK